MAEARTAKTGWAGDQHWREQSACVGWAPTNEYDDDPFFETTARAQRRAAEFCKELCPVLQQCGEWALTTNQKFGVWGGMTESDRQKLKRRTVRAEQQVKAKEKAKVLAGVAC